ncbi:MAG: T9SS type A sorting domain-containing protein [Saprospiraceae bacterium]
MKSKANTYLLLVGLTLMASLGYSQLEIKSPSVIGAAGTISKTNHVTLEWTLGETFVRSNIIQDAWYTEGYHQPILLVAPGSSADRHSFDIRIFPNPAYQKLFVEIKSAVAEPVKLKLTDLAGRTILYQNAPTTTDQIEISMSRIPQGMYLLSVVNDRGVQYGTFKVIKQ